MCYGPMYPIQRGMMGSLMDGDILQVTEDAMMNSWRKDTLAIYMT